MNVIIGVLALILGAGPYPVWQQVYDGGKVDMGHGLCLDSSGRVVVVGETNQASDYDCWTIALSKSGDSLWSLLYDDGYDEKGFSITTTREGNIAVAAVIDQAATRTILYDPNGEFLWERQNPAEEIIRIIATTDKRIYVLGWHTYSFDEYRIITIGYNEEGGVVFDLGISTFSKPGVSDLVVDPLGYIYIGSNKWGPCAFWKYSPEGDFLWQTIYDNYAAKGLALEINDANQLFQAGNFASTNLDFLLVEWDTAGRFIWPEHKAYDLGANEYCRDLKLDSISDCYLTGWQARGEEEDIALVKTDSAGNMLWAWVDTVEGKQEIEGIEVDEDGYIYLAGSHHNGDNWDMLVMKVCQPLTITGRVTDSTGKAMKNIPVVLTGDTTVEVVTDAGGYYSIEVYNGGEYTVSPNLPGWGFTPSSYTYTPLAHREMDQDFEGRWTGITEKPITHPIRLEVNASEICFALPRSSHIRLALYDACGRKVTVMAEGSYAAGSHQVNLPKFEAGIYFVRFEAGASTVSRKLIVLEQ